MGGCPRCLLGPGARPRLRNRSEVRLPPAGAPTAAPHSPRPTARPQDGEVQALDGPSPARRTGPRSPSLTVSVTPAEGRGGGGSVSPTFPEGSARALTSESRRFGAEEGGYPGASSSVTDRSRPASEAQPARGPPRPPAH